MNVQANAKAELIATIAANVAALEAALSTNDAAAKILAWSYNFGVRIKGESVQAVRVDLATIITTRNYPRVYNGRNEAARLVLRSAAIEQALTESRDLLATINAAG